MKIIRTTAVSALAAAALAVTPAVASAEMNQQACMEARIATANRFMEYGNEFAAQGNYDMYWFMFRSYIRAMSYVGLC